MTQGDQNPHPSRAADELADLLREVRDHTQATGAKVDRTNALDALAEAANRQGNPGVAEALRKLENKITGQAGPVPDTEPIRPTMPPSEQAWQRATREAARKLCDDAGRHLYGVIGALNPTEVRCARCQRTWPVGGTR